MDKENQITKEIFIEYIISRLHNTNKLKEKSFVKWKKDVTNNDKYTRYMMWHAVCITLEDILFILDKEQYQQWLKIQRRNPKRQKSNLYKRISA